MLRSDSATVARRTGRRRYIESVGPVRPPKTVGELVGFGRPGGLTFRFRNIMRCVPSLCTGFLGDERS